MNVSETQPLKSDQKLKSLNNTRLQVVEEQMDQMVKVGAQLEVSTKT